MCSTPALTLLFLLGNLTFVRLSTSFALCICVHVCVYKCAGVFPWSRCVSTMYAGTLTSMQNMFWLMNRHAPSLMPTMDCLCLHACGDLLSHFMYVRYIYVCMRVCTHILIGGKSRSKVASCDDSVCFLCEVKGGKQVCRQESLRVRA